jgi:heterotetrameric sarcosine oxidase gamma subunit
VAPAPPVGVLAGWEVSLARSAAPLTLADRTPQAKVLVHAHPEVPGAPAAAFGTAARNPDGSLVVGTAPGAWLVLGEPGAGPDLVRRWAERLGGWPGTVLDATSGRVLLRLTGDRGGHLLAKVCAVDLATAPNGTAVRSSVARVAALVVRDDIDATRSYLLACERSFGAYLHDALLDAGTEFGVERTGFASDMDELDTPTL